MWLESITGTQIRSGKREKWVHNPLYHFPFPVPFPFPVQCEQYSIIYSNIFFPFPVPVPLPCSLNEPSDLLIMFKLPLCPFCVLDSPWTRCQCSKAICRDSWLKMFCSARVVFFCRIIHQFTGEVPRCFYIFWEIYNILPLMKFCVFC